jgi:hypothetical protein
MCRVTFQVLTATSTKVVVLWDVAPCSLVNTVRRFRGTAVVYSLP